MTSCSSSVSVQRSSTSKAEDQRSKSCETACSSNSSCFFQRRKPMNPLMYPVRPNFTRSSGNTVRQRVLSAKLLKLRSIQNQLNDANFHLSELSKENQTLKNLQKRQDKALSKYEGMNEDLPRLIHAHEEQTRVLSEKNKSLRKNVKELNDLLKVKEEELLRAQEKLNHLEKLNRDKHLTEREKLVEQLEDTKLKLQKSDEQIAFFNRKLMLESKASKQRLNAEIVKHKECQRQLDQALMEIEKLTSLLETKENVVQPRRSRFNRLAQRQSVSMITLPTHPNRKSSSERPSSMVNNFELPGSKTPVTDVKLQPIKSSKLEETLQKKVNGILNLPSENIKNRLSLSAQSRGSGDSFTLNDIKEQSSGSETSLDLRENFTGNIDVENSALDLKESSTGSSSQGDVKSYCTYQTTKSDSTTSSNKSIKTRPSSSTKLEKLTTHLDTVIQKAIENGNEEFDGKLGDICSDVVTNVRMCNDRLEIQKESLRISQNDTNTILQAFKETKKLESKLKSSFLNLENTDESLVNEILAEEFKFRTHTRDSNATDKNGNLTKREVKQPRVNSEEKKKLLATLKAIDNGDSFDSLDGSPSHKSKDLSDEKGLVM
ncbi:hypothetical protein NQ315_005565 [Exocentrus adspersus]|uniref:Lebercilin domain-containing protein n=1 Tax=Exocentrus adspersus TaxID=1586481 RepID=A0AAV8VUX0_9CUCU|nr:hypothetical protein NQ315_005565 [Exocentrus adspersus]